MRNIGIRSILGSLPTAALGSLRPPALAGVTLPSTHFEGVGEHVRLPGRGGVPIRKERNERGIAADIGVRALGLAAIALSIWLFGWLHADMQHHPAFEASIAQLATIAIAFLCASVGCGLVTLGRHVHDRIEVADRWRRRF